MPPKSSAKKEPPPVWFACDKCPVYITSKEREQHEPLCPIVPGQSFPCSFIHDSHLYATSVVGKPPADSLITDLSESQQNGFVWIGESTMNLCGWMLGDLVVCSSPQLPDVVPVVRTIWPVPDRLGATVFVTHRG